MTRYVGRDFTESRSLRDEHCKRDVAGTIGTIGDSLIVNDA